MRRDLRNIYNCLSSLRDDHLANVLLYANQEYDNETNQNTIRYINDLQRYDESLFNFLNYRFIQKSSTSLLYPYIFDSVFLSPSIGHRKSNRSYFFF